MDHENVSFILTNKSMGSRNIPGGDNRNLLEVFCRNSFSQRVSSAVGNIGNQPAVKK